MNIIATTDGIQYIRPCPNDIKIEMRGIRVKPMVGSIGCTICDNYIGRKNINREQVVICDYRED